MDQSQIAIAQSISRNQFTFDADEFEQAVLRHDKRRAFFQKILRQCRAQCRKISANSSFSQKLGALRETG